MAPSLLGLAFSTFGCPELLISAASFIFLFVFRWVRRCRRRSTKIPVNWPVMGMLPGLMANIHRIHDWIVDILAESGCTFNFKGPCWARSMDFFVTADPADVNHIFNAKFSAFPKGDEFSKIFDIFGDGIFSADYDSWRNQRRLAESFTTEKAFRSLVTEYTRKKVANGLVPLLHSFAKLEQAFDLQDIFLRFTFDTTCALVLGVDPGCMSPELPRVPFAGAMDDAMQAIAWRYCMPPYYWRMMRFLRIGNEKKLYRARHVIDSFIRDSITKRKTDLGKAKTSSDLLTCYIKHGSTNESTFLRDTTVSLMIAGRDTTGLALTWFFWLLAKNPHIERKILDEINSTGHDEMGDLTYLHAALLDSLRLYPPVPFEMKVTKEDEIFPSGGEEVCAGTRILIPIYAMGRMEGVWGEDCREFRPERWISKEGKLRHEPSYKFMTFNSGPRTCLGKNMALTQMKVAAAAILPHFRFELVPGHVVEPKLSAILHMRNGLKMKAINRM